MRPDICQNWPKSPFYGQKLKMSKIGLIRAPNVLKVVKIDLKCENRSRAKFLAKKKFHKKFQFFSLWFWSESLLINFSKISKMVILSRAVLSEYLSNFQKLWSIQEIAQSSCYSYNFKSLSKIIAKFRDPQNRDFHYLRYYHRQNTSLPITKYFVKNHHQNEIPSQISIWVLVIV